MSLWRASSIHDTPEIELTDWKVYEVTSEYWEGTTRHFSGYNLTEMEGRASSAIIYFDKENMTGRTESGRLYKLSDKRCSLKESGDARYVWDMWALRNKLTSVKDITGEI